MFKMTDKSFLRGDQYRSDQNLDARIQVHKRFSVNPARWTEWVFTRLELRPGERVLEIGCGPGGLWQENAGRIPPGCRILLADLSHGMALKARANTIGAPINCGVADAQDLPFPSASFDCVIANHMLYHLPDLARGLRELRRVLRPGGRLCATTNGLEHMSELHDLVRAVLPEFSPEDVSARRFGLETGGALLANVFPVFDVEYYPDALWITEVEPLVAYVRSMWHTAGLPLVEEKLAALIRAQIESAGGVHIRKSAGMFRARP